METLARRDAARRPRGGPSRSAGIVAALLSSLLLGCAPAAPSPSAVPAPSEPAVPTASPTAAWFATPAPTDRPPLGGTELYGFLPYWQMTATMPAYLEAVPLSTVGLFSVAVAVDGSLKTGLTGYQRIVGARGRAIVDAAHAAGMRVELVFTSFGTGLNRSFLSDPAAIGTAVPALVDLVDRLGLDGLDVDVELARGEELDGYTTLLGELRSALDAGGGGRTLTTATTAGRSGAAMARAAIAGGVDRVFLMGYDYHWSGSQPGASAPLGRLDGGLDLPRSIELYLAAGVPRDRILLGLPLYGMTWPIPSLTARSTSGGKGTSWIPSSNRDLLLDPGLVAGYDPVEVVQYVVRPAEDGGWSVVYWDSPATLRAKLALARVQGLAGSGFWAIGYERGLPGYLDLMRDFRAGGVGEADIAEPPVP
jgi:hypothetical protein